MLCIHGLDESNCPTCRILKSTVPLKGISFKKTNFLNINDLFSKKNINLEKKLKDEITSKKGSSVNSRINTLLINQIPNFRNEFFLKRFKYLDISKEDKYGITKKMHLENPEREFEEED